MCDLSDPRILEAYTEITEDKPTDWLILGYNDTRDVISLYSKGSEGLDEFRKHLSDEVLYGFVRVEDRFLLITWVSEQVSGVRRARALVHSRSVASLFKMHHAQLTASNLNDLSDANVRTRLKLGDNQPSSRRSSTSLSQRRASRRQSEGASNAPVVPSDPVPPMMEQPLPPAQPQYDEFVEASENFVTPPVSTSASQPFYEEPVAGKNVVDEQVLLQEQQRAEEERQRQLLIQQQQQQQKQEELERQRIAEIERQRIAQEERQAAEAAAAAAAAAEQEARRAAAEQANAKRLEEERILKEKMEAERAIQEKKALQMRLLEADRNKDVVLSGFVSVQPSTSPFWKRKYFAIKGKAMALYNDELDVQPATVLDLSGVKRLSNVNIDMETYVPNAFVLETQQNGSYQLFADNKQERDTILTALQTVI